MKSIYTLILTALISSFSVAHAATGVYDLCTGKFPGNGFNVSPVRFQVRLTNLYSGSKVARLHLDAPTYQEFEFGGHSQDTATTRTFQGHALDNSILNIQIDLTKCASNNVCPGVLETVTANSTNQIIVACDINKQDYPAPTQPPVCKPHHCR